MDCTDTRVGVRDMTTRELPPAEWERLAGTELGPMRLLLRPETTRVLVVEDESGAIVGAWSLMCAWHVEGLWIDPAHQGKGSVGRRLLTTMQRWILETGSRCVLTASASASVSGLLAHIGASVVPGQTWLWSVKES